MPHVHRRPARPHWKTLPIGLLAAACGLGNAAEVLVHVTGLADPMGQVGCALYAGPAGFPMDGSTARGQWLPAEPKGVTCRFADVAAGTYAVSVGHDVNGNQRVDTNFLGMPQEQWGVSNNIRPTLRAPRFDEAAFQVPAGAATVTVDIRVAR